MSNSYLIRLSGNVSGPFSKEKIEQYIAKGKLQPNDECQVEGEANWCLISALPEFKLLFNTEEDDGSTAFIKFDKILEAKKEVQSTPELKNEEQDKDFKEFQFDQSSEQEVDYDKIEKEYIEKEKNKIHVDDATVVRKAQVVMNLDKTIIVNPERKSLDKVEEVLEIVEVKEPPKEIISTEDKTQFLEKPNYDSELAKEIKKSEKEIIKEKKKYLKEISQVDESVEEDSEDEEEEDSKPKKMKPIVALAFLSLLYFLIFDDEVKEEPFNPQFIKVTKIYANEFEDKVQSNAIFERAMKMYYTGVYRNKAAAANLLHQSLSHHTENRKALSMLILTYAELLENVKDKRTLRHNFDLLLKISQSQLLKDPNVVEGAALFYSFYGKHETALRIIENYLRINPGKKTKKLLAVYLRVQIKAKKYSEAELTFNILLKAPKKPVEVYFALSKYYARENEFGLMGEKLKKRKELLENGLKIYGSSVLLLLELADTEYQLENFKSFRKTLKYINLLKAEQSPYYYAVFMEYFGLSAALEGKVKVAITSFKHSLKLVPNNNRLRSRLADLEEGGSKATEQLINQSKSEQLMKEAIKEMDNFQWQKAFLLAIDAVDQSENYIPAKLLLAKIQTRRGYFERAINTLIELKAVNPIDANINIHLISAYINAHRYDKAQEALVSISREKSTRFSKTAEFSSLQGRLFYTKGDMPQAIEHLKKAVGLDPLNDKDFVLLAKIFLTYRKYRRVKNYLLSAIKLEPNNVEYRSLYAKVLYELENPQVAIGYLKKYLDKDKNNAKLLGEIATYYYLNGDNKEFLRYKEMVEKLPVRNKDFYEYLISASKIEGKIDKIIEYSKELIKIEPGDLSNRMLLGKYLFQQKKYREAQKIFLGIKERLPSFPKVHYYLAKIYVEEKKFEEALKVAELEIKYNPELTSGYFASGYVYKVMQDYPQAVKQLELAISKDGKNVEALLTLGEIRYGQNFLDSALQLYLRSKRHAPSNPLVYKQLGFIYRRMGQSGIAVENFEVYLNRSPLAQDREKIQMIMDSLK